ncbi:MAG: BrnT family toxin [Acidobacteriota bacterium]
MQFEWDNEKAESNLKKHDVSFEEAETVWHDYFFVDFYDTSHSIEENRFLIIGESTNKRLLIVSYTGRENTIRIISARELTPKERRDYEHGEFEG